MPWHYAQGDIIDYFKLLYRWKLGISSPWCFHGLNFGSTVSVQYLNALQRTAWHPYTIPMRLKISSLNKPQYHYTVRLESVHRTTIMVFVLDGYSFDYAHTWSKSGISICWRHLVTSKDSSNPIFFYRKSPLLLHTWATCFELQSNMSTII